MAKNLPTSGYVCIKINPTHTQKKKKKKGEKRHPKKKLFQELLSKRSSVSESTLQKTNTNYENLKKKRRRSKRTSYKQAKRATLGELDRNFVLLCKAGCRYKSAVRSYTGEYTEDFTDSIYMLDSEIVVNEEEND